MLSRRNFAIKTLTTALGTIVASSFYRQFAQGTENRITDLKTLYIHFNRLNHQLVIRAKLDNKSYQYKIDKKADEIIHNLEKLYSDIEAISPNKLAMMNRINGLGEKIFSPLDSLIQHCQGINFIIPQTLVKFPFDILTYKNKPLFLQKPVIYSFSQINSSFNFSENWSALIVSDPTTDPENGAAIVQEILADSVYYDIRELTLEKLNLIPPKDLVLISAHGSINLNPSNQPDHIILGQESILSTHLSRLSPQLIYLDSCQLGVSTQFIQSLKRAKTQYYIAPILSNEAGNSSTRTIQLFFKFLKAGLSPVMALFYTRTQLYEDFKNIDDYSMLMWRAFPFRLYHLN